MEISRHTLFRKYSNEFTSIYQPTNAHIISHKTLLKHFKTLRHVSILSDHHQGALFLAKVMLQYSQFNSYLQTRCCGSISCCVGMCCGAAARCASYDAHLATAPQHNMICCHNTSFVVWECVVEQLARCASYDAHLASCSTTQHDMLPQHLVCCVGMCCGAAG